MQEPWEDPAWRDPAVAWADDRLEVLGRPRTGDIDQFHVRPWSTVIRLPTAEGPAFFKANAPQLRHEATVIAVPVQPEELTCGKIMPYGAISVPSKPHDPASVIVAAGLRRILMKGAELLSRICAILK